MFGNDATNYDWVNAWNAYRGLGNIYIQSKYDKYYFTTSKNISDVTSGATSDPMCKLIDVETYKEGHLVVPNTTIAEQNDLGLYPYEYTDEDGEVHIFTASASCVQRCAKPKPNPTPPTTLYAVGSPNVTTPTLQ